MNLRTVPHDTLTRRLAWKVGLGNALWAARTLTPAAQTYVAQGVSSDARPAWTDVSYWQGNVNMGILKTAGFHGVFIRAGISWGYKDPRASANMFNAKAAGLYWSTYHVLYPDQSVDAQINNWYSVQPDLDPDRPIPRAIDLELDRGQSFSRIAAATMQMSDAVLQRDGLRPIIYSRKGLVDKWLASWSPSELDDHYWWLAQYLWDRTKEHPGPPTHPNLPGDWDSTIILHQTSDKKPPPVGSVDSKGFDWDRWQIGGDHAMHDWIKREWGPVAPPLTLEQRVERLEGFHNG